MSEKNATWRLYLAYAAALSTCRALEQAAISARTREEILDVLERVTREVEASLEEQRRKLETLGEAPAVEAIAV
ncbi:MAG: hypothetical protein HY558_07655 [Euryarchaeota archaeon]|nr:hypothetical protein [Euryarchaeota archaeon]